MPPFRTVDAGQAGPSAVGILVPPGSRTVVVVRPRALTVDLVMVPGRKDGRRIEGFFEAGRQAAGLEAHKLSQALRGWADGGAGGVEVVSVSDRPGFHVEVNVESMRLIACPRLAGQPYRPLVLSSRKEAEQTAEALRAALCPPTDANQELYTNTSQFGRVERVENDGERPA